MGINGGRGINSGLVLGGSGINIAGGGGFDPDAQAAITAIGADATIGGYLNQLVLDLKGQGNTTNGTDVWSKCYAIYPFSPTDVSTITSDSTKWNIKDPRDLDAAFRITWNNTPVFSIANGVAQNGSNNAYGQTYFIESANMTAGNNGLTVNITDVPASGNYYSVGAITGGVIYAQRHAFNASWGMYSAGVIISTLFTTGIGTNSRRSATDYEIYRAGVSVGTNATSASTQTTQEIFILALNTAVTAINFFNDGAIGFVAIHDGLTDNEAKDIYDAITAWNTSIGR